MELSVISLLLVALGTIVSYQPRFPSNSFMFTEKDSYALWV